MRFHRIEECRPFDGKTGVGHVARDQHDVERACLMDGRDALQDAREAAIAARPAAPAFDAKAVLLADEVNVRQMRDPPGRAAGGGIESAEIGRLVHQRIGKAPDQRGNRKIGADHDHGIGQRRQNEAAHIQQIACRTDPTRRGPDGGGDQQGDEAHDDGGRGRADRTQTCARRSAGIGTEHALGHIAQRLAAERIDRLDRQRIKRPEIDLRHPQQRPPSDPSERDDGQKDKNRAESGYLRGGA